MKITVNIEAESAEDFKAAIAVLSGATIVNTGIIYTPEKVLSAEEGEQIVKQLIEEGTAIVPAPEKPATRSRAKVEKVAEPTPAPEVTSGTITAPELIGTIVTQSNDLLDSPAPVAAIAITPQGAAMAAADKNIAAQTAPVVATNGQASLLDAPAAVAKPETITLDLLRAKIAPIAQSNKQAIKDIIAQYVKADGQPCERPSDVQEKDYALVYNAIDFI